MTCECVEAETYRQMHETARELGYPSILEALEALERLSSDGWMPIESAPKDGTRIMGASWNENCGWRQFVLFWSDRFLPDGVEPFWQFGGCKEHPTHWRPLPEPPAMRAAAPLVEKATASPPEGI